LPCHQADEALCLGNAPNNTNSWGNVYAAVIKKNIPTHASSNERRTAAGGC